MTPEQVAACLVPFEGRDIEYVRKAGSRGPAMPYVRHAAVTRRLIDVFGGNWNFEIVREIPGDESVVVLVRLTCAEHHREQWGGASRKSKMDLEDLLKSATSKALRKAASLFGIGLHLWEQTPVRDDRKQNDSSQTSQQKSPPRGDRKSGSESKAAPKNREPIGKEKAADLVAHLRPYGWRDDGLKTYCQSHLKRKSLADITGAEAQSLIRYAIRCNNDEKLDGLSSSTMKFLEKMYDDFKYQAHQVAAIFKAESGEGLTGLMPRNHRALAGAISKRKAEAKAAEEREKGDTNGT